MIQYASDCSPPIASLPFPCSKPGAGSDPHLRYLYSRSPTTLNLRRTKCSRRIRSSTSTTNRSLTLCIFLHSISFLASDLLARTQHLPSRACPVPPDLVLCSACLTAHQAVYLALIDLQTKFGVRQDPFIVMVVGAGRGPLVRASLRASERAKIAIFVYALDKNPNAVVTLRQVEAKRG
eukprot:488865-Hanusia_phi.AAC.3